MVLIVVPLSSMNVPSLSSLGTRLYFSFSQARFLFLVLHLVVPLDPSSSLWTDVKLKSWNRMPVHLTAGVFLFPAHQRFIDLPHSLLPVAHGSAAVSRFCAAAACYP